MNRSQRRAASRNEAREHAHTFLTHQYGPRLQRRQTFGLTNKNRENGMAQLAGIENGKHIIELVPTGRAIKRVGPGRTR